MTQTTFIAQPRELKGKAVRRLRAQNLIPANVYGDTDSSVAITVEQTPFIKLYDQVGDTGLVYLKVEGEKTARPVLVDDIEHDALTGLIKHVVFRQVSLKEKVTAEVPIEIVGEIDVTDASLTVVRDSIEVEALPTELPEKIVIDVSGLTEVGQMIQVGQLEVDTTKVTIVDLETLAESPVVLVQAQQAEQVEPTAAETEETSEAEAAPESGDTADKPKSE